jgi:hypothetical protein
MLMGHLFVVGNAAITVDRNADRGRAGTATVSIDSGQRTLHIISAHLRS